MLVPCFFETTAYQFAGEVNVGIAQRDWACLAQSAMLTRRAHLSREVHGQLRVLFGVDNRFARNSPTCWKDCDMGSHRCCIGEIAGRDSWARIQVEDKCCFFSRRRQAL